ncbi:hypothetical protein L1267_12370 [Pseudoalteromonas sp. OFAV1]|jgi:hypothetical protein|uniref:hypothetical protein n=1 Tax=Pseudoalteromonas sp. OFAV1 TaxID=2908892 RepID=UPI001F2CEFDB|nr:hypothetical protein [Pseudoalteromonas sp. OFAV1]MCF2901187.1 hypothetical protein [Pseudoalteromonas sp. OFAV1]
MELVQGDVLVIVTGKVSLENPSLFMETLRKGRSYEVQEITDSEVLTLSKTQNTRTFAKDTIQQPAVNPDGEWHTFIYVERLCTLDEAKAALKQHVKEIFTKEMSRLSALRGELSFASSKL